MGIASIATPPEAVDRFLSTLINSAALLAGNCPLPGPSTPSRDELALQARSSAKSLFDAGLRNEASSLLLLERLLAEIEHAKPKTRAQSAKAKAKGKGKQGPQRLEGTPLSELYIGKSGSQDEASLSDEAVWAQMEMRIGKVKGWIRGALGTQDEDEDGSEAEDRIAKAKKLALGMDDSDSDESEDEDDSEDYDISGMTEEEIRSLMEEDSATEENGGSAEEDAATDEVSDSGETGEAYTTPLNDIPKSAPPPSSVTARKNRPFSDEPLSLANLEKRSSHKASPIKRRTSAVDDDFFNLAEFEEEADQGEAEMRRKLRAWAGEGGEPEDRSDSEESDDVDLFKSLDGAKADADSDDEEMEDAEGIRPDLGDVADMMYNDFFDPPPRPVKGKLHHKKSPHAPNRQQSTLAPSKSFPSAPAINGTPKTQPRKSRKVSFIEDVTVRHIPAANNGMRVADIKKLSSAEDEDEDDEGEDDDSQEGAWASEMLDDSGESDDGDYVMGGTENEDEDGDEYEDEDEDEDEDEGEEEGDGEKHVTSEQELDETDFDAGGHTMGRLDSDLFDDGFNQGSDDGSDSDQGEGSARNGAPLSRHARRLKVLSKEIAKLEAENVSAKAWTMKGETSARERPENSLLEQDLEFETINKLVPLVTEEKTGGLEELIKRRIIEGQFDDVVRRRPIDPKAFLPSRMLELQDTASSRSLAEIYADEYRDSKARAEGQTVTDARDAKLEAAHEEIRAIFDDLCGKLDALSNAHFTPKAPRATITTLANLPAVSMESALPTANSTATLLAPEEVYAVDAKAVQRDRTTLTHAQKQLERKQRKKARSSLNKAVEKLTGGAKQGKSSVKAQKEESLKKLRSAKGVTVIGKESVAKGKGKGKERAELQSGNALKL